MIINYNNDTFQPLGNCFSNKYMFKALRTYESLFSTRTSTTTVYSYKMLGLPQLCTVNIGLSASIITFQFATKCPEKRNKV